MVSIIVPVYKVEKYLNRCVKSLLQQTLTDIEIILVDDGSPDRCPAMCDKWTLKDKRIKVAHKENGGLSSARNVGLTVAQGEYVGFVDSDDDVEKTMYERLYTIIEQECVDFVISDYIRVPEEGEAYLKTLDIQGGHYNKMMIKEHIFPKLIMKESLEYGPLLSVCSCLFRKEFLTNCNLIFDEQVRWSEDNIFSAFAGYFANSFYYLKGEGLYHYHSNPGTITTSYRPGAWDVYCIMNNHLRSFFMNVQDYDFDKQLKLHIIFYACNCLGQVLVSGKSKKEQRDLRKKIMQSDNLKRAFADFKFPDCWPLGLKVQVAFIKYECVLLYGMLMG